MNTKPTVCILRSDGTNCDEDLAFAFQLAGAKTEFVHVNELREKSKKLSNFQILALPGGFSYGDDLASGKVLAVELISFFKDDLQTFIDKKGYVLGVCNGFQTLIRTGLLPFNQLGKMSATLTNNDSGHFECRWVKMKAEKSKASYFDDLDHIMDVSVNHGEGKLFADKQVLDKLEQDGLVVFRYVDAQGKPTMHYPENPNGALRTIAGICDKTGRIFGLMPHPEKFVDITQHPNWRRERFSKPHGQILFERIVDFVKAS
ncbi:MAG: phosphoribosylformylglycinamidine synthase I [Candidatus Levybacteria bacterium]|nr:phosphoribosylformylglycinamidine synthase I [Candidatus Levybacteria bacterium]